LAFGGIDSGMIRAMMLQPAHARLRIELVFSLD
jgi:hypothetical protein